MARAEGGAHSSSGTAKGPSDWITLVSPPKRARIDLPTEYLIVEGSAAAEPVLDKLTEVVPDSWWLCVVAGELDDFAASVARAIYERGRLRHLWHFHCINGRSQNGDARAALLQATSVRIVELDAENAEDVRLAENLPADIVVISAGTSDTDTTPVDRWSSIARYIIREASSPEDVARLS